VDGLGTIEELGPDADFHWLTIGFPPQLAPYFVEKGSIAVDGISLTIAALGGSGLGRPGNGQLGIMVIPYTLQHTNLGRARAGDRVNLECDLVGKYVLRAAGLAGIDVLGARSREVAQ